MVLDVAGNIRKLRIAAHLSQDQLAELACLNRVTVAKYESGRVEPGAQALSRIATALGVSVDSLLYLDDEQDGTTILSATGPAAVEMTDEERILVENFRSLTLEGQDLLLSYLSMLLEKSAYRKDGSILSAN